jgi:hypothetical protein
MQINSSQLYQVARDGHGLGSFSVQEILELLHKGEIQASDFVWKAGMEEWQAIENVFDASVLKVQVAGMVTTGPKHTATTEQSSPPKPPRWRVQKPTEKQLLLLSDLGVEVPLSITRGGASDLIEANLQNEAAVSKMRLIREKQQEARQAKEHEEHLKREEEILAEKKKNPAAAYSREVQRHADSIKQLEKDLAEKKKRLPDIRSQLKKARGKLNKASANSQDGQVAEFEDPAGNSRESIYLPHQFDDDEIDSLENNAYELEAEEEEINSEIESLKENLSEEKEELKDARRERMEFWKATFQQHWYDTEVGFYLLDFAPTIDWLLETYGHRFKTPTAKQIHWTLDELDVSHPQWDIKADVALFYQTLQNSHPQLVKEREGTSSHGARAKSKQKIPLYPPNAPRRIVTKKQTARESGCLITVLITVLMAALAFGVWTILTS